MFGKRFFLDTEYGEQLEKTHNHARKDRHNGKCVARASTERTITHCKRRHNDTRKTTADTDGYLRDGHKLISIVRIARERGHHSPIRDVIHRIRDGEHKVHSGKKPDKAPSLRGNGEQRDDNAGGKHTADKLPRLVLAPLCASIFDETAHNGIVESVEYTRSHYNCGDCRELCVVERLSKNAKRQKVSIEKL